MERRVGRCVASASLTIQAAAVGGEGFGGMLKDHGEEGEVDGGKREDVGGVGSLAVCRGGTGGRGAR